MTEITDIAEYQSTEMILTPTISQKIGYINDFFTLNYNFELFKARPIQLEGITVGCSNNCSDFEMHIGHLGTLIDGFNIKGLRENIDNSKLRETYSKLNSKLIEDEIDKSKLREIFGLSDNVILFKIEEIKGLKLLELFISEKMPDFDMKIIDRMSKIRVLRNTASLIHEMDVSERKKAFENVGIKFPILNYELAWFEVLSYFKSVLNSFCEELDKNRVDND